MKGRLLIAGTSVAAVGLSIGISASFLLNTQSAPDSDVPELRAGPRVPAGVNNRQPEIAAAAAPEVQGGEPTTDAEATGLNTIPDVNLAVQTEALLRAEAPAANQPVSVQPVEERVAVAPVEAPAPALAPRFAPAPAAPAAVQRPVTALPPVQQAPAATASVSLYAFEQDMYNSHNFCRAQGGLAGLRLDPTLVMVARQRAADMAQYGYFSHYSPSNPSQAQVYAFLAAAGYSYNKAGENIARNNYADSQSVGVAMNAFMASPGHYANIMNTNYRSIGIGYATGANGMKYYAVVFAY